jgi:hypothetical protein
MARKKQEIKNESNNFEEEFNELEDNTEKEIDLGDEDDADIDFDEGFFFEDEEISFTTKRAFDEEDEEDRSLDIAFDEEDPRDQY